MKLKLKTKFTSVLFLLVTIGIAIVGLIGYTYTKESYIAQAIFIDKEHINKIEKGVKTQIDDAASDFKFLGEFYALNRYLRWKNLGVKNKDKKWKAIVEDSIKSFLEARKYYYKIRFIDIKGNEIINIGYDKHLDRVYSIPKNKLQNKKNREYFINSISLSKGEYYVADINLNRDYGKITTPHIPVLRFAMPVFDKNDVKYGVIVVSLFADVIFENIKDETKGLDADNQTIYLIDNDGTYLYHKEQTKVFDKDLKHGHTFIKDYPDIYKAILDQNTDSIVDDEKIFTFKRIYLDYARKDNYIAAVSITNSDFALRKLNDFNYIFLITLIIVLAVAFVTINYFMNTLLNPISKVTSTLAGLTRGEFSKEKIEYKSDDEVLQMIKAVELLEENTDKVVEYTTGIASGIYGQKLEARSKNDMLSKALNNMSETLQSNQLESQHRSWVQEGINELASKLSGDLKTKDVARESITFICNYVHAGQGAFYVFDTKKELLELNATYAFESREKLSNQFKLGEGLVGQAALEEKPILLTNVKQNDSTVLSATTNNAPLNLFVIPLIYEDELYGAVEINSFEVIDEIKKEFLENAVKVVSAYIYTSVKNSEIKELLAISEQATKEAEAQSEKLQEANRQMEEQQQQVQQQSEELQQVNSQLEEQQQQLRNQADELKVSNEELEQSNRYKSEFLANMSHELRTPLNSIILLSKLLSKNTLHNQTDEDIKKLKVINSAGNELLRLINDILDISKIEAGQMPVHIAPVHSDEIAGDMKDLFENVAEDKGLKFIIEDNVNGTFSTDKDKVSQVLRNFLSNSFKFTKEGSITLKIESLKENDEDMIKFSVIDTGIGIPQEEQKAVFEAFRQADGSITREFGGTGLGLSIAQNFSTILSGHLELISNVGEGTTISIMVPANGRIDNSERVISKIDNKTLLIVEDDKAFAEIVANEAANNGYNTEIVTTGGDAISALENSSINGVVLDIGLPDMSGLELLREMKKNPDYKDMPVYIISAKDSSDKDDNKDIIGYLQKPATQSSIDSAIKTITEKIKEFEKYVKSEEGYLIGHKKDKAKNLAGKKILVVDDDVKNIFVLSSALEEEGADVIDATDGKQALEALESNEVDLILMDIMMPVMDGYEAMREIRKSGKFKHTPIIALTAKAMKDDRDKCIEAGANDYMTKPVDYNTLLHLAAAWSNKKV